MKKLEKFLAVPNRDAQLTGTELDELAREAENHPEVEDVTVRRSNVTFQATPDAIEDLKRKFGCKLIIEPDKPIFRLG